MISGIQPEQEETMQASVLYTGALLSGVLTGAALFVQPEMYLQQNFSGTCILTGDDVSLCYFTR
ncbi:hypothetical protein [Chitinophaga solisilvae]|uniref:hypothetical protein n=1 Tax=Chitinophaga solisilvae TaxID=1233460 RepID=UPI0013691DBF|nr:hypothetical protein [Chitinophaga solisilvae]